MVKAKCMRTDVVCMSGWIIRRLSTHSTSYDVVVSIFLTLLALTGRYLVTNNKLKRVVDCKTCFSYRSLSNIIILSQVVGGVTCGVSMRHLDLIVKVQQSGCYRSTAGSCTG